MCNCAKNRRSPAQARTYTGGGGTQFALLTRDGARQVFGSRLEADAENARLGYTGIVKPVSP